MNNLNRGYCYYCGQETDLENYEEVGNTRLWVCSHDACRKELRNDYAVYQAEQEAQAKDERENGWMSY